MRLTEETTLPAGALPLAGLKQHLQLGSSFALAPDQDALLDSHLRAALAVIEGRIAKALLTRNFLLVLEGWRDADAQALPLAPVSAVLSVQLIDAAGAVTLLDPARYRLIRDQHRPRLAGTGAALPEPGTGGRVELRFQAGFGESWADVPADLAQAVLLLAAEFYEYRHDGGVQMAALPARVLALIEGWRQLRVLGGGRRG